jgi:hypothetical protein
MIRSDVWLFLILLAGTAQAAPYTAPTIVGRAEVACLGEGNPYACCTGPGVGNCINDADFNAHTEALERVDALLRSDITEPANYVLAGPASGANATPTWRALVLADVPDDGTADKCMRSGGAGGNAAWEACQPEIVVTDAPYLADNTGATNTVAAVSSAVAAAPTGVIRLPVGTYKFTSSLTLSGFTGILEGDGPGTIIDCTGLVGDCITSSTTLNSYTLRNLTIRGATSGGSTPNAIKVRRVDRDVRVENVNVELVTGNAVVCDGCTGLRITGGTVYGDGEIQTGEFPRGLYVGSMADGVTVTGVTYDYLLDAIYLVGSTTSPVRSITVDRVRVDGGWWTQKPRYTNSGGTVSYGATTLVDSSAPFTASSVPIFAPVKALTSLATGAVTSLTGGIMNDSGASFSASIKRGDEVRTATAFALVEQRISGTALALTGWRALATRRPVAPPATSTAYTVYGVTLAETANATNTTTTVTVFRWFDGTGATVATPSAATLYEVPWGGSGYGVKSTTGVNGVSVTDSIFVRSGAAGIELNGDGNLAAGNQCKDGKDGCVNFNGSLSTSTGNVCDHMGRFCVALGGTTGGKHVVSGNTAVDGRWTTPSTPPGYQGFPISILSSSNNTIIGNSLSKGSFVTGNSEYCIYVDDLNGSGNDATGNYITDNTCSGFDTAGVRLQDADAKDTRIGALNGATLSDAGSTSIYESLGPPGAAFANLGSPQDGSTVYCSDCTETDPCAGSGNGAMAKRLNGRWDCN